MNFQDMQKKYHFYVGNIKNSDAPEKRGTICYGLTIRSRRFPRVFMERGPSAIKNSDAPEKHGTIAADTRFRSRQ